MRPYFNSPLGVQFSTPLGVPKNVLPAVVSAIGGIAGGVIQNEMNKQQNEENFNNQLKLMSLSEQWQSAENRRAMDWQEKMWNLENAYNTPSAQRARLREAGFSPWQSGGGGAGISPSLAGSAGQGHSSSATSFSTPSRIPMGDFLGAGVSTYLNASAVNANIANQNADTMIKAARSLGDMLKAGVDKDKAYKIFQGEVRSAGGSDDLISDLSTNINQDFLKAKIENDYKATEYFLLNKYGDKKGQAELNKLNADVAHVKELIKNAGEQRNLMKAEAKKFVDEAKYYLEKWTTESETREYLKTMMQGEANMWSNNQAGNSWLGEDNWFVKAMNTLSSWIGMAIGGNIRLGGRNSRD